MGSYAKLARFASTSSFASVDFFQSKCKEKKKKSTPSPLTILDTFVSAVLELRHEGLEIREPTFGIFPSFLGQLFRRQIHGSFPELVLFVLLHFLSFFLALEEHNDKRCTKGLGGEKNENRKKRKR
jgi:hypothetical protein